MPVLVDLALAAALGAVYSVAFVHTAAWALPLVIVAALAWQIGGRSPRRAAGIGLVFGTAWLVSSTWWLFVSLHSYAALPGWMAVLAVLALSASLSLYLAAGFAGFARWRSAGVGHHGRYKHSGRDALLFGAVWLLAELARGVLFTGFPWAASGYAQVDGPLSVLAPWIGVYGIGFIGSVLAAWPALAWRNERFGRRASPAARSVAPRSAAGAARRAVPLAVSLAALALLAATGPAQFTQASGTLTVSLVQPNVPQDQKFQAAQIPELLAAAAAQLLSARGELVVAPETVIPVLPDELEPGYWTALSRPFRTGARAALFGLPLGDERIGYTNSAAGLSAASASMPDGFYRYDKHHLVPFGEFVPNGFHWFTQLMNIPLGDFNRGPVAQASFPFHGERIGANICYEDLFGEELAARFIDASSAPNLFANISNIAWFGDTIAIDQHLQISRMRTLELQRPMLRATNTGATAVIDHQGHVTAALPRYTKGVLDAEVQGRTGLTPFAIWASRFGLWPLWLIGAAVVAIAAFGGRRGRHGGPRAGL